VTTVDLDDSSPVEERFRRINEEMLPAVKQRAGFVAAYWLAPLAGQGMSVVIWDSEEAAREFSATRSPGIQVQPGVTVRSSDVRQVIAAG
jgi:heme-degrading monooxygenase HmoA